MVYKSGITVPCFKSPPRPQEKGGKEKKRVTISISVNCKCNFTPVEFSLSFLVIISTSLQSTAICAYTDQNKRGSSFALDGWSFIHYQIAELHIWEWGEKQRTPLCFFFF